MLAYENTMLILNRSNRDAAVRMNNYSGKYAVPPPKSAAAETSPKPSIFSTLCLRARIHLYQDQPGLDNQHKAIEDAEVLRRRKSCPATLEHEEMKVLFNSLAPNRNNGKDCQDGQYDQLNKEVQKFVTR
ncbi:hypothetical protein COOONC_04234 [Cooperia oncophora]